MKEEGATATARKAVAAAKKAATVARRAQAAVVARQAQAAQMAQPPEAVESGEQQVGAAVRSVTKCNNTVYPPPPEDAGFDLETVQWIRNGSFMECRREEVLLVNHGGDLTPKVQELKAILQEHIKRTEPHRNKLHLEVHISNAQSFIHLTHSFTEPF